jgi:diguanylate cyclase (GGDEF)-like protein
MDGCALERIFQLVRSPSRRRAPRAGEAVYSLRGLDEILSDRRHGPLPAALEARFEAETAQDQSRALFRASLATALVYSIQLLAEATLTPDALGLAAGLHFGVVVPALLAIAAFARQVASPLRRDLMMVAGPILIALQVTATYFASADPRALEYATFLAVTPILANSVLPSSSRAALWVTTVCLLLMALAVRAPHAAASDLLIGQWVPLSICVLLTLPAAFQRNREARRTFLLDLRNRMRMAEVGQEARHDPLTGLANRRRLEEVALQLWAKDAAMVSPISVVLYDVDRFKAYNDLYGHQAGDECLKQIAACALEEIGAEDDVAARYGGEEFLLLLPRTPLEEARRVAERLRAAVVALRLPHAGGEELGVATASFGVATAETPKCSFETLMRAADEALYKAKHGGRNRVVTAGVLAAARAPRVALAASGE